LEVKKSKKNPGARWHEEAATVAGRYRREAASNTERLMYAGMEIAHKDSAKAAQKLGLNPNEYQVVIKKKRIKKNPIAVYNPPAPKVVGTIYNKAIEIRAKKTGSDLAGKYKHVFGKNVKILGLDNGDVVIHHTGGKRLWISNVVTRGSGMPPTAAKAGPSLVSRNAANAASDSQTSTTHMPLGLLPATCGNKAARSSLGRGSKRSNARVTAASCCRRRAANCGAVSW
jgi:hypothetical protein